MDFILCHKCAGTLRGESPDLYHCRCMSGYVRGFEPIHDLVSAKLSQYACKRANMALYIRQGRSNDEITRLLGTYAFLFTELLESVQE